MEPIKAIITSDGLSDTNKIVKVSAPKSDKERFTNTKETKEDDEEKPKLKRSKQSVVESNAVAEK